MAFDYEGMKRKVDEIQEAQKELIAPTDQEFTDFAQAKVEEIIDQKLIDEIITRTEIHGDSYQGRELSVANLRDFDLAPKYKIQVGDVSVWLSSRRYNLRGSDREAIVAYVDDGEKVVPRSYYMSGSHGVWRYLSSYTVNHDSQGDTVNMSWFGKGWGEESVTLSIELQSALASLMTMDQEPLKLDNPDFVFAGLTERGMISTDSGFAKEVKQKGEKLAGNFYRENDEMVDPEKMIFENTEDEPNFETMIADWTFPSKIYGGKISVEVYNSHNDKLRYMFCRDQLNRAWISGIDTPADLSSAGVKKYWVDTGDLLTPAFSYPSEIRAYGSNLYIGRYVDAFKNYLSQVPVIRQYLEHKGIDVDQVNNNIEQAAIAERDRINVEVVKARDRVAEHFRIAASNKDFFSSANSWVELRNLLVDKTVEGSRSIYRGEDLIKDIIQAEKYFNSDDRRGFEVLKTIPRTGGLRSKVIELIEDKLGVPDFIKTEKAKMRAQEIKHNNPDDTDDDDAPWASPIK